METSPARDATGEKSNKHSQERKKNKKRKEEKELEGERTKEMKKERERDREQEFSRLSFVSFRLLPLNFSFPLFPYSLPLFQSKTKVVFQLHALNSMHLLTCLLFYEIRKRITRLLLGKKVPLANGNRKFKETVNIFVRGGL